MPLTGSGAFFRVEPRDLVPAARDCVAAHPDEIGRLPQALERRDAALFRSFGTIGGSLQQGFDGVEHGHLPETH
jgi:hypothetical protein